MDDKIHKCFISSTFNDLKEERRRVIEAILDAHQLPAGMENFNASDKSQWDYIKMMLEDCDYFIVIVAHRYGSTDEGGMSYTEKETRYALDKGIPVLTFIISDTAAWPHEGYEDDPDKKVRLKQFKGYLTADKLVKYWTDKSDLAAKVTSALHEVIKSHPRPGYIRGDSADRPKGEPAARRQPEFAVEFEGKPEIKIDLSRIRHVDYAPLREHEKEISHCQPEELGISDSDVDDWNYSLSDFNDEIDKYNEQAAEYNRRLTAIELPFSISNIGTLKANDLVLTMEFPEWIVIFDGEDELKKPRQPDIPLNPVTAAMNRLKEKKRTIAVKPVMGLSANFMGVPQLRAPMFQVPNLGAMVRRTEYLIINSEHIAEYQAESLQHRSSLNCDLLRLLPVEKKPMAGIVKISSICDELSEPQLIEIPILMDWFSE